MLDRLFVNGRVFDGHLFHEGRCVGLRGAEIAYVGDVRPPAGVVTDLQGAILAPAFIDSHTHADFHVLEPGNDGLSAVSQGVGTLVVGNCGMSATPMGTPDPILLPAADATCATHADHVARLAAGLPIDAADLMGHSSLRCHVMGGPRASTPADLDAMAGILDGFLAAGGLGLSVGLNYPDAAGYDGRELRALCRVLAKHGRPLTCHIFDQAGGILQAIDEVSDAGEDEGCGVLISHLRPLSNTYDHLLADIFQRMEKRDHLAMDLYPYAAGFTSLAWMFQHLFKRLPTREQGMPAADVEALALGVCLGGLADVHILTHRSADAPGKTIAQVAAGRGVAPGQTAVELYLEDPQTLCIFNHSSSPEVVDAILCHRKCLIGSDGYLFTTGYGGACHPRSFAAFTGFLTRYVRSGKLDLEAGLRKITSDTARFFSLHDRGEIAKGHRANLTVFRLDDLQERNSFASPAIPSLGIQETLIAGRTVYAASAATATKPGARAVPGAPHPHGYGHGHGHG